MLSLETAKALAAAALDNASEHGKPVSVCVVDERGLIVYLERQNGVLPFTSAMAEGKAVGSAFTGLDSALLETYAKNNPAGPAMAIAARLGGHYVAARGGLPLIHDGVVIGAIGISGATAEEDETSARVAVEKVPLP
jgi:uncharacterized protein GlcG (DUF336 family)